MDQRGVTLLELILALSLVACVSLAVGTLDLSFVRTSLNASQDIRMQEELSSVFHDMELSLQDGISKGPLTEKPDKTGSLPASSSGPLVYRGTGSSIWLGVANGNKQEVWYGYTPSTRQLIRRIYSTIGAAWSTDVILSTGILGPYALNGPDVNGDKTVTLGEAAAFNACMANANLSIASCENQSPPVFPVFQVIQSDKKNIYISFQGQGTVGSREARTPGMTETIFLHTSAD